MLHVFSARGCEAAAVFLIERTSTEIGDRTTILADVVNVNGETALHAAARGGLRSVATALLRLGANPNLQVKRILFQYFIVT